MNSKVINDERERAYWGPVAVTPEREQAWTQWKDDYVNACIETWVAQEPVDPDQLRQAAAAVWMDISQIDGDEWMPLGPALITRLGVQMGLETGPLDADARLNFLRAERTAETSTPHEKTLATAYHLGITIQQAAKMREHIEAEREREPESGERTALYRHFDENGVLLYVGISKSPDHRSEQHRYQSKWFRFVADTQLEWFEARAQAEVAERDAIRLDGPVFNGTHNRANRAAAIDYLYDALELPQSAPAVADGGAA